MSKPIAIRRKTTNEPIVISLEVPTDVVDKTAKTTTPGTKTVDFKCVANVTGHRMLELSAEQEASFPGGVFAAFDVFITDEDERKRWDDFIKNDPNAPDIEELGDIVSNLIGRYSNRQSENPTASTT